MAMQAEADDRVLRLTRTIAASPERLFDAWTKPEILLRWWGPEGITIPEHELDIRVGGTWRTTMLTPDGQRNICSGVYTLIDRPRRLAFTWAWQQPDGTRGHETAAEVTFEKAGAGTLLTFVQKTFLTAEHRDRHNQGWSSTFNKLERLFD